MTIFEEISRKISVAVLVDLICSFIPLRQLYLNQESINRIYSHRRDRYGLRIPNPMFHNTVWYDRLEHPDSRDGVRLAAIAHLQIEGKAEILFHVFNSFIQDSGHPECRGAFHKWFQEKDDEISSLQWGFINDHWQSIWIPRINKIMNFSDDKLLMDGITHVIAYMIQMALDSNNYDENRINATHDFIASKDALFTRNIWTVNKDMHPLVI